MTIGKLRESEPQGDPCIRFQIEAVEFISLERLVFHAQQTAKALPCHAESVSACISREESLIKVCPRSEVDGATGCLGDRSELGLDRITARTCVQPVGLVIEALDLAHQLVASVIELGPALGETGQSIRAGGLVRRVTDPFERLRLGPVVFTFEHGEPNSRTTRRGVRGNQLVQPLREVGELLRFGDGRQPIGVHLGKPGGNPRRTARWERAA